MAIEQASDGAGISGRAVQTMEDPPVAQALFSDVRWA